MEGAGCWTRRQGDSTKTRINVPHYVDGRCTPPWLLDSPSPLFSADPSPFLRPEPSLSPIAQTTARGCPPSPLFLSRLITPPFTTTPIRRGGRRTREGTQEYVGDINGLAIPAMLEFKLKRVSTLFAELDRWPRAMPACLSLCLCLCLHLLQYRSPYLDSFSTSLLYTHSLSVISLSLNLLSTIYRRDIAGNTENTLEPFVKRQFDDLNRRMAAESAERHATATSTAINDNDNDGDGDGGGDGVQKAAVMDPWAPAWSTPTALATTPSTPTVTPTPTPTPASEPSALAPAPALADNEEESGSTLAPAPALAEVAAAVARAAATATGSVGVSALHSPAHFLELAALSVVGTALS